MPFRVVLAHHPDPGPPGWFGRRVVRSHPAPSEGRLETNSNEGIGDSMSIPARQALIFNGTVFGLCLLLSLAMPNWELTPLIAALFPAVAVAVVTVVSRGTTGRTNLGQSRLSPTDGAQRLDRGGTVRRRLQPQLLDRGGAGRRTPSEPRPW